MVDLKRNESRVAASTGRRRPKRFRSLALSVVGLLLVGVGVWTTTHPGGTETLSILSGGGWESSSLLFMMEEDKSGFPATYRSSGGSTVENDMCQSTKRCLPIHIDDKISYLHISKNAGSSWIQEIKLIKNISMDFVGGPETFERVGLYPTKHAEHEHGAPYQDALLQQHARGPYRRLGTLRSPRHHVWSLFSQCYYSQWGIYSTLHTKFPRQHPTNVLRDFSSWLDHFVTTSAIRKEYDHYQCYHPANYQSRALSSMSENPHNVVGDIFVPDETVVIESYWKMDWVSLTSFFHESKCLLYYRIDRGTKTNESSGSFIRQYLDETCHCDPHIGNNISGFKDIKDQHYTETHKRPTLREMDRVTLQKIDALTHTDRHVYRIAIEQILKEIHWLESRLNRRVLCDSVLDKWDLELEYLDFQLKKTYFEMREDR